MSLFASEFLCDIEDYLTLQGDFAFSHQFHAFHKFVTSRRQQGYVFARCAVILSDKILWKNR